MIEDTQDHKCSHYPPSGAMTDPLALNAVELVGLADGSRADSTPGSSPIYDRAIVPYAWTSPLRWLGTRALEQPRRSRMR